MTENDVCAWDTLTQQIDIKNAYNKNVAWLVGEWHGRPANESSSAEQPPWHDGGSQVLWGNSWVPGQGSYVISQGKNSSI